MFDIVPACGALKVGLLQGYTNSANPAKMYSPEMIDVYEQLLSINC